MEEEKIMGCRFYNYNYKGNNVKLKRQYMCNSCPHVDNYKGYCNYFEKALDLFFYMGQELKVFELILNDKVVDTGLFLNMEQAKYCLTNEYPDLSDGFYTLVNKETGEQSSLQIKQFDFELLEGDELVDFDNLDMAMLEVKIEPQKSCYMCKSNVKGFCFYFGGRPLTEAKKLCFKGCGKNEKNKT
ncbi:MAG: hypothetical protein EHM20_00160 [Alphaproteobacteria bacterium]|nr:MAG: hypothetical protein EHM20_00160 [Alphaproteobacteria bacterium]